jgi:trigger factor
VLKKHLKKFIGLKKDDTVTFEIQGLFKDEADLAQFLQKSPEEAKEFKGKFTFKVKNISRTEPAEMNQEFFDKIFGKDQVKTEKEFIEKYTELLRENYDKESGYLLSNDLQKKLIDSVKVSLPEDFYKKWLLATNQGLKEDDLEKDYEHYLRDLKWNLIKNKIAEDHKIKVEYQDVLERTKEFFRQQYGLYNTKDEEADKSLEILANNYLQENKGEHYMNIHTQVKTEKIMDVVKEKAKISVKKISRDEFNKKVK